MTPARLQTIEEIYRAALDQGPDQIGAFLDKMCGGDEVLRRKVEALLASRQRAGNFMETSPVSLATKIIEDGQGDLLVGQTFDHYKISKRIGTGGMGEVYLATDVKADRKAALKLLPMRFTGGAERLKRFQQEAHAVVGLNHPNILTVYEIGEDHSIHYIASELIEGETLRQRLMRGPMQLSEAVDISIQVASALVAAHGAGIIHRDIKPENIMLRPDGYVKVLDFGIAKLAEQEVPVTVPRDEALLLVETNLGSILGTVRYMSPEQTCGAPVDKRTDIWSLGVVFYEMVTGHAPFTGDTPREVMSAIVEKEPRPLTSYVKQTPPELQQIIGKTLRKDRRHRYHSAHELLEALKDLRRKLEFESFFMSGFFDEVKRRKIYRVAAAYIIVAAGIIQLASAALPAWELPNWALRLVIVSLLIGFPLALILGWAFDITSQGIRPTPAAALGAHRRRNVIMLVATGLIISAAAGFFLLPRVSAYKIDKSIAVLPFQNFSEEKENAFFADGVHGELLSNLAKIKELKVISRTSVMQYKSGIPRNLKEIAQQLGVSNVVEGSVRRSGDHVRVSVQLIDARTDRHVWGQNYDHTLADSLALQGDLATEIAGALQAKLAPEEKARLETKPTKNTDAYVLYLKALEGDSLESTDEESIATEKLYAQAIALDPAFALAWARASLVNTRLYDWNQEEENKIKARAQAEEALRLAPNLGDAHLALGLCLYWGEKDYPAALKEFAVAAAASPNDPEVLSYIAGIYRRQGRWRESIASVQRVQDLDPRNGLSIYNAGLDYVLVRDWPAATACFNRLLEIAPDSPWARIFLAYLEVYRNGTPGSGRNILRKMPPGVDPDGAVTKAKCDLAMLERDFAAAEKILNDFPRPTIDPGWPKSASLGQVALARGDAPSAQRSFMAAAADVETWTRDHSDQPVNHESLGLIYAYMGRKEDAIREAHRAVEMEPESQNAFHGAMRAASLAQVYALTGEADQAITLIERLLTTPGPFQPTLSYSITLAELRLRWEWDSLRKHPRFQKILAGPEPKTVY
jgi:TolB-like protein/Flp pilus assembly protein TadD